MFNTIEEQNAIKAELQRIAHKDANDKALKAIEVAMSKGEHKAYVSSCCPSDECIKTIQLDLSKLGWWNCYYKSRDDYSDYIVFKWQQEKPTFWQKLFKKWKPPTGEQK